MAEQGYNLKEFFRLVGGTVTAGSTGGEDERPEVNATVVMLDDHPLRIVPSQGWEDVVYVDGIQNLLHVTHVDSRPIDLMYVAAGATDGARLLTFSERLSVLCGVEDAAQLRANGCEIPIDELPGETPPELEHRAGELIAGYRERLEREVVQNLLVESEAQVLVDGSLTGRPQNPRVAGVVKSVNSRYLNDERVLYRLPVGWRSPRFRLDSGGPRRYSAYLRMFDASSHRWDHGLIRVETWSAEAIDTVAGHCLTQRQAPGSDRRWDRHIRGVAMTERLLRARRPPVFD